MADSLASAVEYASDRKVDYESMCSDVMLVLGAVLTERERKIVVQSFGLGCPERGLDDIGSDLGLSRERVRQIRERELDKIRKSNMTEAGLASCVISDFRDECHGRFMALSNSISSPKHPQTDCALVLLVTPREESVCRNLLSRLPGHLPVVIIRTDIDTPLASDGAPAKL